MTRGAFLAIALVACKSPANADAPDAAASPQATAMPAVLAAATAVASTLAAPSFEGGPPPTPFRGDENLAADTLGHESGYTLSAVLRPIDLTGPPRTSEVNQVGLEAARRKTELKLAIDLGATRMRVAIGGRGFVLPDDTEIRARSDRFGHVAFWSGGNSYRPLPPGALRALVGERRFDVAPLGPADIMPRDETGKRIGIRTRKVDVMTRAAKVTFEIGRLADAGEGGVLLARMLLDLACAPPQTPLASTDEVPVRAELRWTAQPARGISFELTGVLRKVEMTASALLVPPPGATFASASPDVGGVHALLAPAELAAFRTNPIEVGPNVVGDGLAIANATLELRVLYIDGVAVAWAAPGARDLLPGLVRGRYVAQWRTFLGDAVEPPVTQLVPGMSQVGGGPDGGPR